MQTSALHDLAKLKHQERLDWAANERLARAARQNRRGPRRPAPWAWFDRLIRHRGIDQPATKLAPPPSAKPARRSSHMQPFVIHTLDEIHAGDSLVDTLPPEPVEHREPVSH